MSMNKKITALLLTILTFSLFKYNVYAIDSYTTWNASTEEISFRYKAEVSGIRKIWLDCSSSNGNQAITLYIHGNGFTKEEVTGTKDTNNLKNGTYVCEAHVATEGDGDDRESAGDITFTKKNYDASKDTSGNNANYACSKYVKEEECVYDGTCKWENGTCTSNNIADRPCDENEIKTVLRFFGYLLLIARVAVPLIIIGFATFDLFKSVVDKDEKSFGKQIKMVGMRILAGFIVFFIPNIVGAVFTLSDTLNVINTDQYKTCANCLLHPTNKVECEIDEN